MPRRGRGNSNNNNRQWSADSDNRGPKDSRHEGRKYYYEHDQRGADLTRRVSFKAGTSNRIGKNRRPDWDKTLQSRLGVLDEDVDMAAGQSGGASNTRRIIISNMGRGRGRGRGGSRGGRQGSPPSLQKKLTEGPSWYQIRIPHGHKYEKSYIVEALQGHIAPLQLVPFLYMKSAGDASFYVDTYQVADALHQADRRITTAEGYKLLTRVRPSFPPVQITDTLKEKIKLAMATRYNHPNKSLDLERFHMDPQLVGESAVALFRPNIMLDCLDIVAANIPDVQALNLGNNNIGMINHLSVLATKLPHVKILHIGQNQIRDVRQLDTFKEMPLVELVLDGNPLCDKFKDRSLYVSQVSEKFSKLRKLDGVDLGPQIQFETEEETPLPENTGSFFINQDGRPFVRQFLEQYMLIYDSDDRTPLKAAYHEQAAFSMASAPLSDTVHNRLDSYIPISRNLLRVKDPARRHKFLHNGRDDIVSFLSELPSTTHDPVSFAVDMPIYTPQLIQVCVTGIFRERGDPTRGPAMRCFSRVFVIVPVGAGFCIINESFFITNVTAKQQQSAFLAPTPAALPGVELKTRMVHALRENTKMNLTWANKCLEETNWNYDLALGSFNQLQKLNAIPPEAFVNS